MVGARLCCALLAGWLAGGIANWAADVLPGRGEVTPGERHGFLLWHYFTLPWYFFRRGRSRGVCPHCGLRRPLRAPLLEIAAILTYGLAWWRFPASPLRLGVVCLYAAFLLAVLVIDFEHRRVLNIMLAPAAAVALGFSFLPDQVGSSSALLGGAIGFGLFLLIALIGRGKMGWGDVKLAGVIGLMTGYPAVVTALLIGILLGGLAAVILLISRRASRKSTMAYAPYLALGAIIALLL